MRPWTLDRFMKVLFGVKTTDVSRLHGLMSSSMKSVPDRDTLKKLLDGARLPNRSTFENCVGLETGTSAAFLYDFCSSSAFSEGTGKWEDRFDSVFEVLLEIIRAPEKFQLPSDGSKFLEFIVCAFPHFFSSVLHVEAWVHGELQGQFVRDFPTILPHDEFRVRVNGFSKSNKVRIVELHIYMLHFSSLELDICDWETCFKRVVPSEFVPSWDPSLNGGKGGVVYPMESFWRWLRGELGCRNWNALAKRLCINPAQLNQYKGTTSLDRVPSWSKLRSMLRRVDPHFDFFSEFGLRVHLAYGLARLLQEHASRCLDVVTTHFARKQDIERFYLERIESLKSAECRRIPLHSAYEEAPTEGSF